MADKLSVSLAPKKHDKLGILHIGVTREGFVAVAGDVANLEDKSSVVFAKTQVKVERNGSLYTFTKQ